MDLIHMMESLISTTAILWAVMIVRRLRQDVEGLKYTVGKLIHLAKQDVEDFSDYSEEEEDQDQEDEKYQDLEDPFREDQEE